MTLPGVALNLPSFSSQVSALEAQALHPGLPQRPALPPPTLCTFLPGHRQVPEGPSFTSLHVPLVSPGMVRGALEVLPSPDAWKTSLLPLEPGVVPALHGHR